MTSVAVGMAIITLAYALHPRLRVLPPVDSVTPADFDIDVDVSLNSAGA